MEIDFDPAKDAINRDKHGVSLAFGERVLADAAAVIAGSFRPMDNERRWKAIGLVDGRLWTAVHVIRGATYRMISVRKSNDVEARAYHRHSGRPQ